MNAKPRILFEELRSEFKRVLIGAGLTDEKAALLVETFAGNSRDGVYTHGLNRFPVFVADVKKALPIGYWKGSGLSLLLNVLLIALTGDKSVAEITRLGNESGVCQCFIAFKKTDYHPLLIDQVLSCTKSSATDKKSGHINYPAENTLRTRNENLEKGIPAEEKI